METPQDWESMLEREERENLLLATGQFGWLKERREPVIDAILERCWPQTFDTFKQAVSDSPALAWTIYMMNSSMDEGVPYERFRDDWWEKQGACDDLWITWEELEDD